MQPTETRHFAQGSPRIKRTAQGRGRVYLFSSWCQWVFSRQGKQICDFYTAWRSACERAALANHAKLLHDLRRTGVRNLIRAGVPEKVAMLISGHKTRSIFDRYHIVQTEDIREAMNKLDKHLKGRHGADERT
jgi:intergrase/recombinase